ncbi:MAG: phosphoribosylglycinamide formyltransferase, partial [Acidimicrobiia bacterium]|nr:phosphoribosylglycinamide formyltransferase [Acidimicrobiia bacterium]
MPIRLGQSERAMGVARLAVLVSGSGTNLAALLAAIDEDDAFGAEVVVVLSDRPDVRALERAQKAGIDSTVVDWTDFATRDEFTEAVCEALEPHHIDLVVLAGFMRILAPVAIERYPNRIVNTHPALLPAFPGGRALEDALEHGVKVTGVT